MKATDRCSNCGELTTGKLYFDALGPHMLCEHCGSSFDTDAFYKTVTHEEALSIIETREPTGLFLERFDGGECVGIDNLTGDAWTEEFDDEASCLRWLAGEYLVYRMDEGDVSDENV